MVSSHRKSSNLHEQRNIKNTLNLTEFSILSTVGADSPLWVRQWTWEKERNWKQSTPFTQNLCYRLNRWWLLSRFFRAFEKDPARIKTLGPRNSKHHILQVTTAAEDTAVSLMYKILLKLLQNLSCFKAFKKDPARIKTPEALLTPSILYISGHIFCLMSSLQQCITCNDEIFTHKEN